MPAVIAHLDIDALASASHSYGHQAGDELLADAATPWTAQMRTTDLLARYGGEEFVIVLPNCAQDDAPRVLERILDRVPEGQTCSIGFACWDGEGHASPARRTFSADKQATPRQTSAEAGQFPIEPDRMAPARRGSYSRPGPNLRARAN